MNQLNRIHYPCYAVQMLNDSPLQLDLNKDFLWFTELEQTIEKSRFESLYVITNNIVNTYYHKEKLYLFDQQNVSVNKQPAYNARALFLRSIVNNFLCDYSKYVYLPERIENVNQLKKYYDETLTEGYLGLIIKNQYSTTNFALSNSEDIILTKEFF